MKWVAGVLLVFVSCAAFAQGNAWMKQKDPNSLGLFVAVDEECPFSEEEVTNVLEGEYLRARIKPTQSLVLNITVSVTCVLIEDDESVMGYAVSKQVRFGTRLTNGSLVLYEMPDYGSLDIGGTDSKRFLMNSISDAVSSAITDYLKVNFQ